MKMALPSQYHLLATGQSSTTSTMPILETAANHLMAHPLDPLYIAVTIVANALAASRLDHIQAITQPPRCHRNQSSIQSDLRWLHGQTATIQHVQFPNFTGK